MAIPYMGSKAKISEKLMNEITLNNPQADTFIDLFGGGGAMSEEALRRMQFKRVIYNELNAGVANLMRKIQQDGITPEFYEWVSRDEFNAMKNGDCWKSGLIKTCWSFGNNGKEGYLYGEDIEKYKKAYHDLVVNDIDTRDFMQRYAEQHVLEKYGISQSCVINIPSGVDIQKRRLEIRKDLTVYEKQCKQNNFRALQQLQHLERLQQLEHLERLQQLERLNGLNRLEVFNQSAFDFDLSAYDKDKTVIYLDPPYIGTAQYQEKMQANIDRFAILGFTVYLSEYKNPNPDFWQEVFSTEKRDTMSQNKSRLKIERLFKNKE